MAPIIDKVLGLRCTSYGYQYSEIVGSLSSVYFCGGDCVEDVTSHLMPQGESTDNSIQMQQRITKWKELEYTVKSASVRFIVAWKPKDAPKDESETAVLLPDLVLARQAADN